jgi:hypothetical protein
MEQHLRIAETIANVLDNQFSILGFRFGLDPLLNFVPFLGAVLSGALSLYLIWVALEFDVSPETRARMLSNIGFDFLIGLVPVVGTFADFFVKANIRNIRLLREELARRPMEGIVIDQHVARAAS